MTKKFSDSISIRIKELRKENGMTQKQLAEKLYKSESTVRMWELGKSEPDAETISKLSNIFKVSIDYMFGKPTITKIATQREFIDINDANLDEDTKEKLKEIEADAIVFNVNSEEMKKISNAFLQNKQKPADEGELVDNDKVAKVALFGGDTEVTDEMWSEVMNYAEYIKQKYGKS